MKISNAVSSAIDYVKHMFTDNDEINHIHDLQDRLELVASKATYKGNRKPIGSTTPFIERIKRDAKLAVHSVECQFSGNIMADGRHEFYEKDGILIQRTSSI